MKFAEVQAFTFTGAKSVYLFFYYFKLGMRKHFNGEYLKERRHENIFVHTWVFHLLSTHMLMLLLFSPIFECDNATVSEEVPRVSEQTFADCKVLKDSQAKEIDSIHGLGLVSDFNADGGQSQVAEGI